MVNLYYYLKWDIKWLRLSKKLVLWKNFNFSKRGSSLSSNYMLPLSLGNSRLSTDLKAVKFKVAAFFSNTNLLSTVLACWYYECPLLRVTYLLVPVSTLVSERVGGQCLTFYLKQARKKKKIKWVDQGKRKTKSPARKVMIKVFQTDISKVLGFPWPLKTVNTNIPFWPKNYL